MRKRKLFHKFMVIPKVFSYLCSIIPFGGLVLQSLFIDYILLTTDLLS